MYELDLIWGWQPALYLFLGGLGAGTFLAAAYLHFAGKGAYRKIVSAASLAAFACVAVGLLLLLAELIKPVQGLLVWQSFSHFTSWMTYGAWIAMGAMACFVLTGILTWLQGRKAKANAARAAFEEGGAEALPTAPSEVPTRNTALNVIVVIGCVFALALAFYTGMLLMCAEGVALWHTALLPCLFTISAIDTGIALVELIALACAKASPLAHAHERTLRVAVITLVILEGIVLAVFLGGAAAGTGAFGTYAATAAVSANFILTGGAAVWFWAGIVACGLVCPLVMALVLLRAKQPSAGLAAIGPAGALIGGCVLRFVILFAGIHVDLVGAVVTLM